jgi:hypothetical protein
MPTPSFLFALPDVVAGDKPDRFQNSFFMSSDFLKMIFHRFRRLNFNLTKNLQPNIFTTSCVAQYEGRMLSTYLLPVGVKRVSRAATTRSLLIRLYDDGRNFNLPGCTKPGVLAILLSGNR